MSSRRGWRTYFDESVRFYPWIEIWKIFETEVEGSLHHLYCMLVQLCTLQYGCGVVYPVSGRSRTSIQINVRLHTFMCIRAKGAGLRAISHVCKRCYGLSDFTGDSLGVAFCREGPLFPLFSWHTPHSCRRLGHCRQYCCGDAGHFQRQSAQICRISGTRCKTNDRAG